MYNFLDVLIQVEPHQGKELTGRRMYQFAENFSSDLGELARLPLPDFFMRVADIPYESDDDLFPGSESVEVNARPAYLLDRSIFPALDCKKKSILMGAWARENGIPFRFLAVSELPTRRVHHVFADLNLPAGGWTTADATFPHYRLGQGFPLTFATELAR